MHPLKHAGYKLSPRQKLAFVVCTNTLGHHPGIKGEPYPRYIVIYGGGERSRVIDDPTWEDVQGYRKANPTAEVKHVVKLCEHCQKHQPPDLKLLK